MGFLPKVSIIIAAYNVENTIEECIHSLLALSYPQEKLEIIFVDNSSSDNTLHILNTYRNTLRILQEERKGPAAARNKGLFHATGEIIAFTDADCTVDKDWIQKIIVPLQDRQVGVVGGRIAAARPCNKIEEFGETIHDHEKAIRACTPPYVNTGNWASRLTVLKEVNGFDENLITGEDSDLSRRIYQAGYRLVYEPEAIVYHRNEKTLWNLFKQGFRHGFGSVKLHKKQKALSKKITSSRFQLRSYLDIVLSLSNYVIGKNRNYSLCYFIFNSGKKIGRISGSIRFLYLAL